MRRYSQCPLPPRHTLMHKRLPIFRAGFAIAALALLAAIAAVAVSTAAPTNCSASSSWGTNRADLASQVVTLINQYRTSKGLGALAISSPLTASSEWKSLHMAGNGYFDHNDQAPPVARSAHQRAIDCGYGGNWWGENIAYGYGSAQAVVNGWLASAGHKANIENARFTSTGVGVAANGSGQLYWTQNFGDDTSGGSAPPPPPRHHRRHPLQRLRPPLPQLPRRPTRSRPPLRLQRARLRQRRRRVARALPPPRLRASSSRLRQLPLQPALRRRRPSSCLRWAQSPRTSRVRPSAHDSLRRSSSSNSRRGSRSRRVR